MKILIKGSEGDTVTFYQRDFLPYMSRVAGFAPRHLSRWTALRHLQAVIFVTKILCAVLA